MSGLYLHIGHNKTGSSYLQSVLSLNKSLLNEHGFDYPIAESLHEKAAKGRVTSGNHNEFLSWSDLNAFEKHKKIIFSSEMFFMHLRNSDFQRHFDAVLKDRGVEFVNILLFVRDPLDLECSGYQQKVKGDGYIGDLEGYIKNSNYFERLDSALNFLDSSSVNLEIYNYSIDKESIVEILERWLGLGHVKLEIPDQQIINRSLTRSELKLQAEINQVIRENKRLSYQFSRDLVEGLPNIVADKVRPAIEAQEAYWDMHSETIQRLNARLPEHARFSRERDIQEPNLSASNLEYGFSGEQIRFLGDFIADLLLCSEKQSASLRKKDELIKGKEELLEKMFASLQKKDELLRSLYAGEKEA